MDGRFAAGQYLLGDEADQQPPTRPDTVINFDTRYQLTDSIQLFGEVEDITGGTYAGAPIAGFARIRLRY